MLGWSQSTVTVTLFPSGSARLSQRGVSVIERVGDQLKDRNQGYRVDVQGHTDNVPIRGDLTRRYPTNWELAAARASSVVRVLEGRGVGAKRLSAVSLGEYHPVESNRSPQGRAKNRRIEIRLVPLESAGMEMPASGTGASASASTGGSPASEEDILSVLARTHQRFGEHLRHSRARDPDRGRLGT